MVHFFLALTFRLSSLKFVLETGNVRYSQRIEMLSINAGNNVNVCMAHIKIHTIHIRASNAHKRQQMACGEASCTIVSIKIN